MIRPLTCICMLLAGGSGLYLYQSKHRAQMLDREIEQTLKATDAARDRIGVLRGEWALLNEPERLAALSQAHLKLKTLAPSQFVTVAELGMLLPPPAVPGEEPPPPAPVADAAKPSGLRELPQPPAPAMLPVAPLGALLLHNPPTPAHPVAVAAKAPPRPALTHPVFAPVVDVSTSPIVTAAAPRPAPARLAPPVSASAAPPAASVRSSAPAAAGLSIGESVARAAHLQDEAQPVGATGPTLPAYSPPAHHQTSYSQASALGALSLRNPSALGGIRPLLPPPVPIGSVGSTVAPQPAMAASVVSVR